MNRIIKWITRMRIYSDIGMWWLPSADTLVGVYGILLFREYGFVGYAAVRIISVYLGWRDLTKSGRIKYQSEFMTRETNPYFEKIEKDISCLKKKLDKIMKNMNH